MYMYVQFKRVTIILTRVCPHDGGGPRISFHDLMFCDTCEGEDEVVCLVTSGSVACPLVRCFLLQVSSISPLLSSRRLLVPPLMSLLVSIFSESSYQCIHTHTVITPTSCNNKYFPTKLHVHCTCT